MIYKYNIVWFRLKKTWFLLLTEFRPYSFRYDRRHIADNRVSKPAGLGLEPCIDRLRSFFSQKKKKNRVWKFSQALGPGFEAGFDCFFHTPTTKTNKIKKAALYLRGKSIAHTKNLLALLTATIFTVRLTGCRHNNETMSKWRLINSPSHSFFGGSGKTTNNLTAIRVQRPTKKKKKM